MIEAQNSIKGKANATIIREFPPLENIEVTPSKETQNLKSEDFYGFNNVTVVGDENLDPNNIISSKSIYGVQGQFDCDVKVDLYTYMGSSTFYNKTLQDTVINVDMSNTDTTGKTSMNGTFNRFSRLSSAVINMKGIKSANSCFANCSALKAPNVKIYNTEDLEDVSYMFESCKGLTETVDFDTSHVKSFTRMYQSCTNIKTFKKMDCSNATSMSGIFNALTNVSQIEGFINYGKGFTEKTALYSQYTLDLFPLSYIDHDDIMNVINNLYDLNLTYDVANGGTLYTQKINLGSSHKNKISEAEKQIARDKGWTVGE